MEIREVERKWNEGYNVEEVIVMRIRKIHLQIQVKKLIRDIEECGGFDVEMKKKWINSEKHMTKGYVKDIEHLIEAYAKKRQNEWSLDTLLEESGVEVKEMKILVKLNAQEAQTTDTSDDYYYFKKSTSMGLILVFVENWLKNGI